MGNIRLLPSPIPPDLTIVTRHAMFLCFSKPYLTRSRPLEKSFGLLGRF